MTDITAIIMLPSSIKEAQIREFIESYGFNIIDLGYKSHRKDMIMVGLKGPQEFCHNLVYAARDQPYQLLDEL